MFELRQFVDGRSGELRKTCGVEFFARDGKDRLSRIDQRSQHNHGPFRFKPIPPVGAEVLQTPFILNEFRPVDHLPLTFLLGNGEDIVGIPRSVRIEPIAFEQFQGIEYRRGLPGTVLAGDGAEGVLHGLGAVASGDEHREARILRRLLLKVGAEADARNSVDQIAEVDALVGADSRDGPDGFAHCPLGQQFGTPLVGNLEGPGHIFLEPLYKVAQEMR